jgi:zona occludens toxin (predicted ATPase)
MGTQKLLTAGGGGVQLTPASSIASDVTVQIPSQNCTLGIQGPAFSAFQSVAQTLSDNVTTKLTINTEDFDTNSCFDISNNRFIPNVAGYYQIQGAVYFTFQSAYSTVLLVKNNNSVNLGPQAGNGAFTYGSNVSAVIYFNGTTDFVELFGYQNSGTSRDTTAGRQYTYFSGALVRAA